MVTIITCRLSVILAERRIRKGEFAKMIGVGNSTFSAWVNDKSIPTLEMAYRVAEELDLNVMEIWVRQKETPTT